MKNFILSASALLFTVNMAFAQKVTVESLKQTQIAKHKNIVTQALTYSDMATAINSMHQIIALEGANSTYKDSLAIAYFRIGKFDSSHLLTKELLANKPNNVNLLEISAVSLERLGAAKEAITAYEKLFTQTKNMAHGYQLANLQYGIKRLAEAQATITLALQCKEIENSVMAFPVDKNQNQNVPLKAAAHNLNGIIAYELKDLNAAASAFKKALEIMPKFAVATQNNNAVTVELQNNKNKTTSTTSNK